MLGIMYIQMHGQPALGIILSNKYEGHWVYASGVTQEARSSSCSPPESSASGIGLPGFPGLPNYRGLKVARRDFPQQQEDGEK